MSKSEFKKARDEQTKGYDLIGVDKDEFNEGADWAYEWCGNNIRSFFNEQGKRNTDLEKKLAIAVEALEQLDYVDVGVSVGIGTESYYPAKEALSKIKGELDE